MKVNSPSGAGKTIDATLRVPATELDAALADLKKLGHVEQESQCGEEVFFFYVTATTEIYTLSLHDALPIWLRLYSRNRSQRSLCRRTRTSSRAEVPELRSEEDTSELQSLRHLVCSILI